MLISTGFSVYAHIFKFSVVRQDQVNLHRILCTSHTGHIHRGDFVASHALTKAIVKSYNPGHDGQKVGSFTRSTISESLQMA